MKTLTFFIVSLQLALNVFCEPTSNDQIALFESEDELAEFMQSFKQLLNDPQSKVNYCKNLNFESDKCDEYFNFIKEKYNVEQESSSRKKRQEASDNNQINKKKKESTARRNKIILDSEDNDNNNNIAASIIPLLALLFNNQPQATQIAVSQPVNVPLLNLVTAPTTTTAAAGRR